jgi:hypothetical protein
MKESEIHNQDSQDLDRLTDQLMGRVRDRAESPGLRRRVTLWRSLFLAAALAAAALLWLWQRDRAELEKLDQVCAAVAALNVKVSELHAPADSDHSASADTLRTLLELRRDFHAKVHGIIGE